MTFRRLFSSARAGAVLLAAALLLSACEFSPYALPLPGGADTGDKPYTVKAEFRDVLDLVPQSGVRVDDVAVGRVTDIQLSGWHAEVTLKINGDATVPANSTARIRQTSLLGEKFVSLEPPESGAQGKLTDGDVIPLERSGRNPEVEEVLGAASLLFNGGGLDKVSTIVREVNHALDGNEDDVKELLRNSEQLISRLDSHKGQILNALEKINNVALEADKQSDAITTALDTMPEALDVLNDQRDELVTLLNSLDEFGQVGSRVIRRSKADLLANLQDLQPVLANLNQAGDNLVKSLRTLPSFPFSDEVVGGSYAAASSVCPPEKRDNPQSKDACMGDYKNLYVQLNLSAESLKDTILNLGKSVGNALGDPGSTGLPGMDKLGEAPGLDKLPDLVGGLAQQNAGKSEDEPEPTPSDDSPEDQSGPESPKLCSVLQLCRPAAGDVIDSHDSLRELMLQTVVEP